MSSPYPITYQWDGEAMRPAGAGFARKCNEQFVIGQRYRLEEIEERSQASHNHEFGWLSEAWRNLPEDIAYLYPSSEHLRKRALIQAGYYNEMAIDAGSNAAAIRVAAGFRSYDDFCIAVVQGPMVLVRTAKSQSRRAMDKATFQASKTAIMELIADMIHVDKGALQDNAGKAA